MLGRFIIIGLLPLFIGGQGATGESPVRIVTDVALTDEFHVDIRWQSEGLLLLTSGRQPKLTVLEPESGAQSSKPLPDLRVTGRPFLAAHLATSGERLALGSIAHHFAWIDSESETVAHQRLGATADLDLRGDQIVILGLQNEGHSWSPDGTVAWLGRFTGSQYLLQPILSTASRKVVDYIDCHGLQVGAVRFLNDGSFVIVPGVDRGVHHFNSDGKLIQSWSSPDRSIVGCSATDVSAENVALAAGRAAWINRQVVVDDVVPLNDGFGLIVRRRLYDEIKWELLRFRPGSQRIERLELPVRSKHESDRVKADFADGTLALLMVDVEWSPDRRRKGRLVFVTVDE